MAPLFARRAMIARLLGDPAGASPTLPAPRPPAESTTVISRVRAAARIEDALRPLELGGLRTRLVAPRGNDGPVAVNLARYDGTTGRSATLAWVELLLDGSIRLRAEDDPLAPELVRASKAITETFRGMTVQPMPRDPRMWSVGGRLIRQSLTGAWAVEDAEGHPLVAYDTLDDALRYRPDDRDVYDAPVQLALSRETTAKAIAATMRDEGVAATAHADRILVQDEAGRHVLVLGTDGLRVPEGMHPDTLTAAQRAARAHLPGPRQPAGQP